MSWTEAARVALEREGYVEPEKLLGEAVERAAGAKWVVLPYEAGYYLSAAGEMVRINVGTLSGERATWWYLQRGPYLRLKDEDLDLIRREAERAGRRPLEARLLAARAVLDGWTES